jgi:hypothetical protein
LLRDTAERSSVHRRLLQGPEKPFAERRGHLLSHGQRHRGHAVLGFHEVPEDRRDDGWRSPACSTAVPKEVSRKIPARASESTRDVPGIRFPYATGDILPVAGELTSLAVSRAVLTGPLPRHSRHARGCRLWPSPLPCRCRLACQGQSWYRRRCYFHRTRRRLPPAR